MNILTFDIEEWFHLLELPATSKPELWGGFEHRLEANTDRLLLLMDEMGVKATCFVLGWVAQEFPQVVKKLAEAGHELGIHSYDHSLVFMQSRRAFAEDIRKSCDLVGNISGKPVTMFRAPGFSIVESTLWAFEELVEQGITADSSVFPASRAHGGFPSFPTDQPCIIDVRGFKLYEFPLNTSKYLGTRMIFSGGGYFRLMPYPIIRNLSIGSNYVMTYFHPRDFDPGQKVLPGMSPYRIFKSYYGLGGSYNKLKLWLDEFEFVNISTAIRRINWDEAKVIRI
ncbi:MAG: polysaccharide deacetylase family protein [Bacteroidales bacterium]|nr:polysaccharide deacetylase family protein [Bacteroidales bacterium]